MTNLLQNNILPNASALIGFSWLVEYLQLSVPLREFSCVSDKRLSSQRVQSEGWTLFDAQFAIEAHPFAHLEFALKHEKIDLLVLKQILMIFPKEKLTQNIASNPKDIKSRTIF